MLDRFRSALPTFQTISIRSTNFAGDPGGSDEVWAPAGLHPELLPAHCPAPQPAERLWPLADEGLGNTRFRALADLGGAVARRVVALKNERVRALTCDHCLPAGGITPY